MIMTVAGQQFAERGYERTTVRSVAAAVPIDPALVIRYFTSKAGLFAEAARAELTLPDLTGLEPADLVRVLVDRFFEIYEEDGTYLALLRAAATSPTTAGQLRAVLLDQAAPALAAAAVDQPAERAALVGAQIIGFAYVRYVLAIPALAEMTRADVWAWVGPVLLHYLRDPIDR